MNVSLFYNFFTQSFTKLKKCYTKIKNSIRGKYVVRNIYCQNTFNLYVNHSFEILSFRKLKKSYKINITLKLLRFKDD